MSCTAVWVLSWVLGTASDKMDHVLGLPYGPAVKTPSFQRRDVGSIPGQGTKIPHATWGAKKLKKKNHVLVLMACGRERNSETKA